MSDTAEITFKGKTYKVQASDGHIWRSSSALNNKSSVKNVHSLKGTMEANFTLNANVLIFIVDEDSPEQLERKVDEKI